MTKFFSYTSKGPRPTNQDSVLVKDLPGIGVLCCVADGVGGNNGGEIASNLAIESFFSDVQDKGCSIREAIENAHLKIIEEANKDSDLEGMATTFTAALISGASLTGVHCGDSRAYLLRGNGIKQLTSDHSEVAKLLAEGKISKEDAINYPRRNVLYSALGSHKDLIIEEFHHDISHGDYVVLITDGFYQTVSKQQFRDIFNSTNSIDEFGGVAVRAVEEKGAVDNYSLVAVDIN